MSYEMRRAQHRELTNRRVASGDHRQVKRQMRRMLNCAVRCAIDSSSFADWSLVVVYRNEVQRARARAKANRFVMERRTAQSAQEAKAQAEYDAWKSSRVVARR